MVKWPGVYGVYGYLWLQPMDMGGECYVNDESTVSTDVNDANICVCGIEVMCNDVMVDILHVSIHHFRQSTNGAHINNNAISYQFDGSVIRISRHGLPTLQIAGARTTDCLLYTSPSPRD